jgi:hypothetical protein
MAISAQSIVHRVVDILQDTTSVRWPVSELVRYLNDGQREVVLYRPDATIKSATVECVAGAKQTLPNDGAKLIDVIRNSASAGTNKAVRMVAREVLDAQIPNWYGLSGELDVVHFTYDPRDPKTFFVYPPALTTTRVDITYSAFPTDVSEPAAGSTYDDVSGNLDLPDIYGNVVTDYILYRAYSKDSEYAGNAQRAQAHYGAFANALNIEVQGTTGVAPTK